MEEGVYSYGARFYDSALGRFISADTLIPQPGSPLAWDRYAYANGNPIRYNDPSGHMADGGNGSGGGCITGNCRKANQNPATNTSKPWHYSRKIDLAYHIGWSVINAPDQSSDDFLNESSACSYGQTSPLCVLVVLERFGVGIQKDTDANFWIHFNATYDEALGVSITDFSMVNYSESPLKITNLFFLDRRESVSRYAAMIVPNGFGGDTKLPNSLSFSGEHPITIIIEYEQTINTGSAAHPGPSMIYPEITIGLPSLASLKYSVQTGELSPLSYP